MKKTSGMITVISKGCSWGLTDGRVERVGLFVALLVVLLLLVPPLLLDLLVEPVALLDPFVPVRTGQVALLGQTQAAVDRYPHHYL
jgi:hypothetical protein